MRQLPAGLAAERGKPKDFAVLEATIVATKLAKTLADVSRLDAEFHDRVVRAAGNRRPKPAKDADDATDQTAMT